VEEKPTLVCDRTIRGRQQRTKDLGPEWRLVSLNLFWAKLLESFAAAVPLSSVQAT